MRYVNHNDIAGLASSKPFPLVPTEAFLSVGSPAFIAKANCYGILQPPNQNPGSS